MTIQEFLKKYPNKEFGLVMIERIYKVKTEKQKTDKEGKPLFYHFSDMSTHPSHGKPMMEIDEVEDLGWEVYLDHSCDRWIIGSLERSEEFNRNLSEAIEFIKNNP